MKTIYPNLKHLIYQVLFLLTTIPAVAQDLSISPISLTFEGTPGQTVSKNISLSNSSKTKTYNFSHSLSDWDRDSLGSRIYHPNGNKDQSMSNWIELSENTFTLAPGESKNLTVTCNVPQQVTSKSAYNSILFITQTNPSIDDKADQSGIGILVAYEFGIDLYYNPIGASLGDMEINAITFNAPEKATTNGNVKIEINNTGQINKNGTIKLEITNKSTGVEVNQQPIHFGIMPHGKQQLTVPMSQKLEPGSYLLVAILDAGRGHSLKIAEKDLLIE